MLNQLDKLLNLSDSPEDRPASILGGVSTVMKADWLRPIAELLLPSIGSSDLWWDTRITRIIPENATLSRSAYPVLRGG
jgi:hypothetical protein